MNIEQLQRRIRVARGQEPGDLLITRARIANVFTERFEPGNVIIADGWIAGVGPFEWEAQETIEADGRLITPGLIDAHMHIESTLMMPAQFARVVVPHGTTAVIADPHEIGNVLGVRGIELMIALAEGLPLDCFFMAPSCVPASPFESAGATIGPDEVVQLMRQERVLGLAEMMNFPGVLHGDEQVLRKILATLERGGIVDGHCPGVLDRDLQAYASTGIASDHECTTPEEALQRAAAGLLVQVREGSMARNLDTFLPLMVENRLGDWCLCTDDIHPEDLVRNGHLDHLLARVVAGGLPPARAIRHTTLVPARHYGLRDRGAVAPGYRADLVLFQDEKSFTAEVIFKNGRVVARGGEYLFKDEGGRVPEENTIRVGTVSPGDFEFPIHQQPQHVIGIVPDQIVTTHERREVKTGNGRWIFDPSEDVALIACVHRHGGSGRVGVGLVGGFGFRGHGALGSSVGHDAHNLVIAGTNALDMHQCVEALKGVGGGFVVVSEGQVKARLALPVAGLMSTGPVEDVCRQQREVDAAAKELGCPLHSPFGTLSFLALSVIPSLKITDRGLFDVERFELV